MVPSLASSSSSWLLLPTHNSLLHSLVGHTVTSGPETFIPSPPNAVNWEGGVVGQAGGGVMGQTDGRGDRAGWGRGGGEGLGVREQTWDTEAGGEGELVGCKTVEQARAGTGWRGRPGTCRRPVQRCATRRQMVPCWPDPVTSRVNTSPPLLTLKNGSFLPRRSYFSILF